jgi:hypothetical protein
MKSFWFSFTLVLMAEIFIGLLCLHLLLYPGVSVERFEALYPVMEAVFQTTAFAAGVFYLGWADWNVLRHSAPWMLGLAPIGLFVFYFAFRHGVMGVRYDAMAIRSGWPLEESDWLPATGVVVVAVLNAIALRWIQGRYSAR